jgi:hypothetical protein
MADPNAPPAGQSLFDALSGAAGFPVNRPALNSQIQNGQALAGLRTAQTQEALLNAQRAQEEQDANAQLEQAYVSNGLKPSDAHLAATISIGNHGNAVQALQALQEQRKLANTDIVSDPNQLNTAAQTAAFQGLSGKPLDYQAVPKEYAVAPGIAQPNVQQTPLGAAETNAQNANAGLHNVQAAAGGFRPQSAAQFGLDPNSQEAAAVSNAVNEGRLDPSRLNSRTAGIFGALEARNPGTNFNQLIADSAMQRNSTAQQKFITMESLPTIMAHMTALGKKLNQGTGYSDWRTAGKMQQFMNGEFNDPDYAEYMPVRNDALMSIASVMRGQGMSDQAHTAEIEAAAPTMTPLSLDAWLKGQMSSLQPRLERMGRAMHQGGAAAPGNPTMPTSPQNPAGGGAPGAPSANDPLGIR